jgi:hypothetical protein
MPRVKKADAVAPTAPGVPAAKPARVRSPKKPAVSHEQIAFRAHELFMAAGATHGRDLDHWFRAERELLESQLPAQPGRRAAGAPGAGRSRKSQA